MSKRVGVCVRVCVCKVHMCIGVIVNTFADFELCIGNRWIAIVLSTRRQCFFAHHSKVVVLRSVVDLVFN